MRFRININLLIEIYTGIKMPHLSLILYSNKKNRSVKNTLYNLKINYAKLMIIIYGEVIRIN